MDVSTSGESASNCPLCVLWMPGARRTEESILEMDAQRERGAEKKTVLKPTEAAFLEFLTGSIRIRSSRNTISGFGPKDVTDTDLIKTRFTSMHIWFLHDKKIMYSSFWLFLRSLIGIC